MLFIDTDMLSAAAATEVGSGTLLRRVLWPVALAYAAATVPDEIRHVAVGLLPMILAAAKNAAAASDERAWQHRLVQTSDWQFRPAFRFANEPHTLFLPINSGPGTEYGCGCCGQIAWICLCSMGGSCTGAVELYNFQEKKGDREKRETRKK